MDGRTNIKQLAFIDSH